MMRSLFNNVHSNVMREINGLTYWPTSDIASGELNALAAAFRQAVAADK